MRIPSVVLGVLLTCSSMGGGAAGDSAAPLGLLEANGGSIGWGGLNLGVPLHELEHVLGYSVFPEERLRFEEPPSATVIRHGRVLRLGFARGVNAMTVATIAVQRMGSDRPEEWSKEALVRAAEERIPDLIYQPSRHDPELVEAENPIPMYRLSSIPRVCVLLKPEEGFVLIAREDALD